MAIILNKLTKYINKPPNSPNKKVAFKLPEKAIIKDKNKIIILNELHPSIILETYSPFNMNFIDNSSVLCST